ncbi:hypothetical protein [uncultured Microscilla sp.]|uniref:hypothetical protein n=1 Tax=uncultured Microscilla sp. TaxID=432653 RepID=UPI00261DAE96|nr:hypothetical protein [uncultured Microscilla sp.]
MTNIFEFLKTGFIYGTTVGMSRKEVLRILKTFDNAGSLNQPDLFSHVFKDTEFVFYEDELQLINFDLDKGAQVYLEAEDHQQIVFTPQTSLYSFCETLDAQEIAWEFYQSLTGMKQITLMTEGETLAFFSFEDEIPKLEKIQLVLAATLPPNIQERLINIVMR